MASSESLSSWVKTFPVSAGSSDVEVIIQESHEFALAVADILDGRKASDISVLDVADVLQITEIFVIATGTSNRQVRALADEVIDVARDTYDRRALRKEGTDEGEWVLLDFGDIVVHVFQPDTREFYDLERLWADAPRLEWVAKDPVTSSEEE